MGMRKVFISVLTGAILLSLTACGTESKNDDKTIKFVAANIKLYEDTTKILAEELEKKGYKLEYKFVSDNTQLNEAVQRGEAYANYHQHIAFLNEFNSLHHTDLVPAFKVFTDASGIFSKKYKSASELPDGAIISIPVDPSNNFRTFVMLANEGLIKLKDNIEPAKVTEQDIVDNPHHFKFKSVDYALLTRALDDVDAGFLYATLAAEIGLIYSKDALIKEQEELSSPDVITVLDKNKDAEKTKALQEAYQTDRMKQAFKDAYDGEEVLTPGW